MKTIRINFAVGAVLLLCSAGPSGAEELDNGVTANLAFSTDYLFRFVSQTLEEPSLSGGLDWESDSGFYLGAWGSNVDFGDDASLEVDFYGGYVYEFDSGWSIDTGFIDYEYFDDQANDNILEVFTSVSRGPASLSVYYEVEHGGYYWFEGSLEHTFGAVDLKASAGVLEPDQGSGYSGWSLQAGVPVSAFDVSLTWADTNGGGQRLFGEVADSRVVLSVAYEF